MNDDGMQIVRLGPGDEALLGAAVSRFREVTAVDHTAFLGDASTLVMVAMQGVEVVGWAWGIRHRHVCGYWQLLLYEIEVAKSMRRRGVARALMEAFLEVARVEGHAKMWLMTSKDNTAAMGLYRAMGGSPSLHDDAGFWWQLAW